MIAASRCLVRFHGPRNPQFSFAHGKEKPGWHYAHHRERLAIQRDVVIDDSRIAIEASTPKRVAQHHDVFVTDSILFGRKRAAQSRRHTQQTENVRRDELSFETFRLARAG